MGKEELLKAIERQKQVIEAAKKEAEEIKRKRELERMMKS